MEFSPFNERVGYGYSMAWHNTKYDALFSLYGVSSRKTSTVLERPTRSDLLKYLKFHSPNLSHTGIHADEIEDRVLKRIMILFVVELLE